MLEESVDLVDKIIVVAPDQLASKEFSKQLKGQTYQWAYLGNNLEHYELACESFREYGQPIEIFDRFHEIANLTRDAYLSYLYHLGETYNSLAWWVTSLSYRQRIASKTFEQACYLRIGVELIESHRYICLVLVVSDHSLPYSIRANLSYEIKDNLVILAGELKPKQFKYGWLLNLLVRRIFFVIRESRWVILSRLIVPRVIAPVNPITLIVSTLSTRNVDRGSQFHGFFFGDLAARFSDVGATVCFMPLIIRVPKMFSVPYRRALKNLISDEVPLLVHHRYLHLSDVFKAAFSSLLPLKNHGELPLFSGLDISGFVAEELQASWISNGLASALLMVSLAQRWESIGVRIDRIIYVYENQPWERALCWGIRSHLPNTTLVGYQHARTPKFMLNFHLAPGGEELAPLPDFIVTNGGYTSTILKSGGFRDDQIRIGASFQMQSVDLVNLDNDFDIDENTTPSILFATSEGKQETAELILMACNIFEEGDGIKVIIKCHPLMPFTDALGALDVDLPAHVRVIDGPILDLISKSTLMIYTGSTVCVQALSLNVPVIHFRPRIDFDMDPLEFVPEARLEANGLEDLRNKVSWLMSNREDYIQEHSDEWSNLVNELFGTVTDDVVNTFI